MRVHHLNCGCMCPIGGAWFDGFSKGLTARLVCHCLLVETERHGLVLVDTGFGSRDVAVPGERLSGFFRAFNNICFEHRLTALEQVRQLGFDPADVRHIVLTHLDFDHAGGLSDFPEARVHVLQREYDAARGSHGFSDIAATGTGSGTRCGTGSSTSPAATPGSASSRCATSQAAAGNPADPADRTHPRACRGGAGYRRWLAAARRRCLLLP